MKKKNLAITSLMMCLTLSGCGTTLGENTGIFFSEMKAVMDVWFSSSSSSSATKTEDTRAKLDSVTDFTVKEDGTYTFTGTDSAAYYVITVCASDATEDDDTYLYSSSRIDEDGSGTYTGNVLEMFTINYGEYLVKCFAYPEIGDEENAKSAAEVATLTVTGDLEDPQVEYFWNIFDGTLTLQIANMTTYDETCVPDSVDFTITAEDGTTTDVTLDEVADANNSIAVSDLSEGSYSITAVAHTSNEYANSTDSNEVNVAKEAEFGKDNVKSDGYTYTNTGLGHGYSWPIGTKTFDPTKESSLGTYSGADFVTTPADSTLGTKDNSVYSFTFICAVGFGESGWMSLYDDGTCAAYNDTSGPVSASSVSGTWYENEDGTITINWDMNSVEVSLS